MVEIDTGSKWVDLALKGISTLLGFAAAGLVGSAFNSTISNQTGLKRAALEAGKLGVETVVTYEVAGRMNNELNELVDGYNTLAHEINEGRRAIRESDDSGDILYDEGAC